MSGRGEIGRRYSYYISISDNAIDSLIMQGDSTSWHPIGAINSCQILAYHHLYYYMGWKMENKTGYKYHPLEIMSNR